MLPERFTAKLDVGDCWEWTAALNHRGYGHYWSDGGVVFAHRFAYEWLVGPIPDGLTIDHLCRNRRCVNPDHLEPVTIGENILRGEAASAKHARKTHCPRGHAYDGYYAYIHPSGRRVQMRRCLTCKRAQARKGVDA